MKNIWIHKSNSFKKAEDFDKRYYSHMSSSERLEMVQFLREKFFKIKGQAHNAGRKRLRRFIKIIQ